MPRHIAFAFLLLLACLGLGACQSTPAKGSLSERQIAALKQEGFQPSDEGWEFSASEKLLFGSNEAVLVPSARQAVERLGRLLIEVGIPAVRIDGHTDTTGSAAHNDQLSLRRAQAVAEVMAHAGLATAGIQVRGLGSRAPIASNNTPEGRAQNRRVVLVVIGN